MRGTSVQKDFFLETDKRLRLIATDIRRERTGVHARVHIGLDADMLAWNSFNVERDEDRTRLSNAAHKHLGELDRQCWSAEDMRKALSGFCLGLWDASLNQLDIGLMAGKLRAEGAVFPIRPFVIEGGGTIIYAPPGRGKSFTAMLMSVSLDAGYDGLFAVDKARPTLYVNIERSADSMADRLARINDCLGVEAERPMHFMNQRGRNLQDIIEAIRRYVDQHKIDIVMLDSISRSGFGDLNENSSTNKLIDALNGACSTWAALAHTPRQDESHVYGSVHFDAGIDVGVKLTTQLGSEGAIGVGLVVTKANDAPTGGKPLMFVLEFDQTGLKNVRQPARGEFIELESGPVQSTQAACMAFLKSYGEANAGTIALELGLNRSNVSSELNKASWATKRKVGKEVLYGVRYEPQN